MPRRSQEERTRSTRSALTTAARTLFASRGYSAVSTDEIVRAAGVTRGALYHHYADKQALFEDVFEQLEGEISDEISAVFADAADHLSAMAAGVTRFLDICQRPEVLRIALTDAPAVLGWSRWREIEARHGLRLITAKLSAAAADGLVATSSTEALAQLVLSAVIESALMIANGADRDPTQQALTTLLLGLVHR
ncbi:TetR/AcrR family transcriptional regulator [Kutzneria sp. CA-103260]|uniref:TetR/AcrR family transcriptional regulator n=1 Tax=Kutzneria sp. CA-103260 TaxID=2802641 RepID=UPI001BA567ED|nr:TetR/AcrR family transcriptional regulator [Kutzneria sp. CA-103260]QUQ71157.1 TetR family transcriptional regulator [Kutzneria sp. CA-103260]